MAKSKSIRPTPRAGATASRAAADVARLREAASEPRFAVERVADETLIVHDGRHGIFTPIESVAAEPGSAQNLGQVVDVLKSEVAALREKNVQLEARLRDVLEKPPRTPDDFATAVKHSLDGLQSRLSEMTNPVCNFAVREFTLEAKVMVDVSPLGTVDYRFVQPGDAVDPARLSRLAITLSPVPKETSAGTFSRAAFTPLEPVEEIQGVGTVWGKRLNAQGIYTVSDLLTAATRSRGKAELEGLLAVDREKLEGWLKQAELLTVRDVDGRAAEVLAKTGVGGLDALAKEEPAALATRFNAEAARAGHKSLEPVDEALARTWIDTARAWVGTRTPIATNVAAAPTAVAPEAPQR